MKVLIASAGRSGTRYTSYLLSLYGLDVGHEHLGRDGMIGWNWIQQSPQDFDLVLHQSREPLAAIRSAMTHTNRLFKNCEVHYGPPPISGEDSHPKLIPAMWYWLNHNKLAKKTAGYHFKVEHLGEEGYVRNSILFALGLEKAPHPKVQPPRNLNSRKATLARRNIPVLTWQDLTHASENLSLEIQSLAQTLGYSIT